MKYSKKVAIVCMIFLILFGGTLTSQAEDIDDLKERIWSLEERVQWLEDYIYNHSFGDNDDYSNDPADQLTSVTWTSGEDDELVFYNDGTLRYTYIYHVLDDGRKVYDDMEISYSIVSDDEFHLKSQMTWYYNYSIDEDGWLLLTPFGDLGRWGYLEGYYWPVTE